MSSPGETINNLALAIAADLAKAAIGLATLAVVIMGLTLLGAPGTNGLQKIVRANMLSIIIGIMAVGGAGIFVAFVMSSTA